MKLNIQFKDNSTDESSFKIFRSTNSNLSEKVEIFSLSYSYGWVLSGSNNPILKSTNSAPSQTGETFSIDFDEDETGLFFYGVGAYNIAGNGSSIESTISPIQVGETTTLEPTTLEPTTLEPTTLEPTTLDPTTLEPDTICVTSSSIYLNGSFTFSKVGEINMGGAGFFPIYEGINGSDRPQVKIESHYQSPSNIRWVLTQGNGTTAQISYSYMNNKTYNYKSSVPIHPANATGWQINSVSIVDGSC